MNKTTRYIATANGVKQISTLVVRATSTVISFRPIKITRKI